MIPPLIVEEALQRDIHLIAITDHNGTANIAAVQKAARGTELTVLPGMELQTREEIHLLCLFDTLEQAQELQGWVDRYLPSVKNNVDFFGEQFVVDETGDFIRNEDRLLINSVDASLNEAWAVVDRLGGLLIPAHVNRKAYGLIPVLGLVPTDIPLEGLEISRHLSPADVPAKLPQAKGYPLIQDGDVHFLDDFLGSTVWYVEKPEIAEMRLALKGEEGRAVKIVG
jgi:3',5'-nucleoside bisphosphate phosphatase